MRTTFSTSTPDQRLTPHPFCHNKRFNQRKRCEKLPAIKKSNPFIMPPLPGQEEPMKRITKIVDWLITRPDCAPFREPVDWRGLYLWDYPEIIEQMMDLGTIKRRLERGFYQRTYQVAEDVRLVWRNCMTYNADG
jgi:hypothetical protein